MISNTSSSIFAAVSDEPVPIIDSEFIPDVYDEILSFADNSKFIYEHYEDLPQWRHDKIRDWVLKWIKDGDWTSKPEEPMARFYKEKWPEYWLEAVRARRET